MTRYVNSQPQLFKILVAILLVLFLSLTLNGCSTTKTNLKSDVDVNLKANEGYLLIGVNTNQSLDYILITGQQRLLLTDQDLHYGKNYILTTAPAGTYQIEKITTHSRRVSDFEQQHWNFDIKPGRISYIGDLEFNLSYFSNLAYVQMNNRSSSAIEFLQNNFPKILQTRELHYSGPGQDRFLQYYYQFIKNQNQTSNNNNIEEIK